MKVTIGFSKPRHKNFPLFSWLIRLFEGTPYSHVYLKWYSEHLQMYLVYHAAGSSMHFLGPARAEVELQPIREYELDVTPEMKRLMVVYCVSKAGTPYGLRTVVGIALKRLLGTSKNVFADGEKTQFCSEFISRILSTYFHVELPKDPDSMGLKDLEGLLIKLEQGGV